MLLTPVRSLTQTLTVLTAVAVAAVSGQVKALQDPFPNLSFQDLCKLAIDKETATKNIEIFIISPVNSGSFDYCAVKLNNPPRIYRITNITSGPKFEAFFHRLLSFDVRIGDVSCGADPAKCLTEKWLWEPDTE